MAVITTKNTRRKRTKKCGKCKPCLIEENCMTCWCCKNREKGKQICIKRKCLEIIKSQKLRNKKKVFE